MADYSDLAGALNPYSMASRAILSNPVQGDAKSNPWQLALANMAQGFVGGALGGYGEQKQAEAMAAARKAQFEQEVQKMQMQKQIEKEAAIAQAQEMLPIEKQKAENNFEITKQSKQIDQEHNLALEDIRNVHAIAQAYAKENASAQNAGIAEKNKLQAQAEFGALPNQGNGKIAQEQAARGQSLLTIANDLEDAVNKLENSKKPTGGASGMIQGAKNKFLPGSSPSDKLYQEYKATTSQAFPKLVNMYHEPGSGPISDYEQKIYRDMMPSDSDTPAAMRWKIERIKADARGMMGGQIAPQPIAPQSQPMRVVMPTAKPELEPAPDLSNMSLEQLGQEIAKLKARRGQ